MAIIVEQFAAFGGDICFVYIIYDDRNTTNTTRWRVQAIRVTNNHPDTAFYAYVEDPATGLRFPDNDPNLEGWQPVPVAAGTSQDFTVPAQFQNASPYDYSWGAGGLPTSFRGSSEANEALGFEEVHLTGKELKKLHKSGELPVKIA